MTKKILEHLIEQGYLHVLYALLVEIILLLLISFAGLFTLETILPGLISTRFVIGKIIITVTLLVFFTAFLGNMLDIEFPLAPSRLMRSLFIGGTLWIISISVISLISFPFWSIPLFLLTFGAIRYLAFKEIRN